MIEREFESCVRRDQVRLEFSESFNTWALCHAWWSRFRDGDPYPELMLFTMGWEL